MLRSIQSVYHQYGFEALESSAIETVEALGKFLPDVDRPNEGVFAWKEEDDDWIALRYDLTAPLARVYAQYKNDLPSPYRRYAIGPVWRNEKPGLGRYRQFYQCDVDTVGSSSVAADAEICMMLSDILELLGISVGDYIIKLNNRKILNGILETIGLKEQREQESVLRTLDKFDKVGEVGVCQLLGDGRLDSSGAFIKGVGLSASQIDLVLGFLKSKGRDISQTMVNLKEAVFSSKIGLEGVLELEKMVEILTSGGYASDRITIDPSVVRGLGYYTGPVYEAELQYEIFDDKGRKRHFGAVSGGGRYDGLIRRFTGQEVPSAGVSIGIDRLLAALRQKGFLETKPVGPVVVTVMDRDRISDYLTMVSELRKAGVRAEMYLGNPKNFGNQLKYADKRNSPIAIIEGENERRLGVVQIKDLFLGAEMAKNASLEEWRGLPSQFEIPRTNLVTRVKEILSKNGVEKFR